MSRVVDLIICHGIVKCPTNNTLPFVALLLFVFLVIFFLDASQSYNNCILLQTLILGGYLFALENCKSPHFDFRAQSNFTVFIGTPHFDFRFIAQSNFIGNDRLNLFRRRTFRQINDRLNFCGRRRSLRHINDRLNFYRRRRFRWIIGRLQNFCNNRLNFYRIRRRRSLCRSNIIQTRRFSGRDYHRRRIAFFSLFCVFFFC